MISTLKSAHRKGNANVLFLDDLLRFPFNGLVVVEVVANDNSGIVADHPGVKHHEDTLRGYAVSQNLELLQTDVHLAEIEAAEVAVLSFDIADVVAVQHHYLKFRPACLGQVVHALPLNVVVAYISEFVQRLANARFGQFVRLRYLAPLSPMLFRSAFVDTCTEVNTLKVGPVGFDQMQGSSTTDIILLEVNLLQSGPGTLLKMKNTLCTDIVVGDVKLYEP